MIGVPLRKHAEHVIRTIVEDGLILAEGGAKLVGPADGGAERLHKRMREWRRELDLQLITAARETGPTRCRRAKRFYNNGMSIECIANELEVVPADVRLMLRSRRGYYWSRGTRATGYKGTATEAYRLHVTMGKTVAATAKKLNVATATVVRYVRTERAKRDRS